MIACLIMTMTMQMRFQMSQPVRLITSEPNTGLAGILVNKQLLNNHGVTWRSKIGWATTIRTDSNRRLCH